MPIPRVRQAMERGARMDRPGRARRNTRRCWFARGSASRESGLTLIELVIAMSVFGIMAGGIAAVTYSGLGLASDNRNRSVAANLASEDIDAVNQLDYTDLAADIGSTDTKIRTVGGVAYTVKRAVGWQTTTAGTNICSYTAGGSTASWVVGITTTVTWPGMRSTAAAAHATTFISPPVGNSPSTNSGTVPVTVRASGGDPVVGVTVGATDGSNVYSSVTDANGCAFLLVAPSTYTLTLNTLGYVDRSGNPAPSMVFSISKGKNVPINLDFDRSGSLSLATSAPNGALPPSGLPVTLAYQFFQPTGTKVFSGSTFPLTLTGLFPDDYQFWAGDCTDADPSAATWSGGGRDDPASVVALGTTPASVSLGTVAVSATLSGVPVSGASVTASHSASVEAALPWGTWTITVTPSIGSPRQQTVIVDPTTGSSAFLVSVSL